METDSSLNACYACGCARVCPAEEPHQRAVTVGSVIETDHWWGDDVQYHIREC